MKNLITFSCILFLWAKIHAQGPGLIVNEVSQGNSGTREYVELVVIAPPGTCTVDIRQWVIDDNNGDYSGGPATGAGIASGHIRFTNDPQWESVPTGSIILIYNAADKNISITLPDDISDSNNDKVYIIPSNTSSLLERCTSIPNTSNSSYGGCTYTTPIWDPLGLANDGDVMQVRTPAFAHFHGLSFGDGTCNCIGAGPGVRVDNCTPLGCTAGRVYSFTHNSNDDFNDPVNYTNAAVPAGETPGAPNNAANAAWRNILLNCNLPLPAITLGHELVGNQVILRYQITQDEVVKNLILQHSANGKPWENLAHMDNTQTYIHTIYDNEPHYYRILYQDKDGNTKISNTLNVRLEGLISQELEIYPNPVPHDIVTVSLKHAENGTIQVFNLLGELIYQASLQNGQKGHTIDVYGWQNGVYLLRFVSYTGGIYTQKIVKSSNF
ncbi:MAG: T9SS type A sorting domain-containing protein [Bacteroidia bacterium]|nr:T9SS type A sorting domain-containing protein [Bacteroidia bacterium]